MEILTFIFLMLNLLVMVFNAYFLYHINLHTIKASELVYSDFWNKNEVKDYDLYS